MRTQMSRTGKDSLRRAAGGVTLALLLLASPAALAAGEILPRRSHGCFSAWWQALIEQAEDEVDGPYALASIRLLDPLVSTAADPQRVVERLDALRSHRRADPLVADEIDAMLLGWDRKHANAASAQARLERLGMIRGFALSGPFSDREDAEVAARERDPEARPVETAPDGVLPLDAHAYPPEDGFAVAAAVIEVTGRAEIAVRYGADDQAQLWVDGAPLRRSEGRHDAVFDQYAVGLRLEPGRHTLAWLVDQDDGAWTLLARLTDPDGQPLPSNVRVLPQGTAAPEPAADDDTSPRGVETIPARTLTGELRELADRRGRARAHLALDLAWRQLPERSHTEANRLAREAAEEGRRDPAAEWMLARVEADPSRAREALERVLDSGDHDPAVVRELAHYHLRHGQIDTSLKLVRRGLRACEQGADPYLEAWEAALVDGSGFPEGAIARLRQLAEQYPRQPLVFERLAAIATRIGFTQTASKALTRLLELNQLDDDARRSLIELAVRAADADAVVDLLEGAVAARPLDLGWHLELARHHLLEGNPAIAQRRMERARVLSPNHPAVARIEGEIALAAGQRDRAAAAWRRALERGGESFAGLRARLSNLTGGEDAFGQKWALSIEQARERFEQAEADLQGDPAFVVLHQLDAFRLESDGRSTQFRQLLIGVRHPDQADGARSHTVTYSPSLQRATILDARLVRRDGSVVVAARSERSLLPDPEIRMWYDTRVIQVGFPRLEEGDVLEIRYRVHDRGPTNSLGTGYFGRMLAIGRSVPTLSSRAVVETPEELPVRHRAVRLPSPPEVVEEIEDGTQRTIIDVPGVAGYPDAPLAPPPIERVPYLVLGTVDSWERLGTIYADLLRPQLRPTTDLEQIVDEVVAGADDRREIVERLYRWLLENTRYVALEFGIHAIKPYPTDLVLRRRHGDCKDKASLLVTMLELAGVRSHVALVRTRDQGRLDTGIPVFDAFNHAIVYVPGEDLWLDGTVLHHGPGELPLPDREALALIVDTGSDEDGSGSGRLVTTPPAEPSSSSVNRTDRVRLERSGAASIDTRIEARGEAAARARSRMRLADDRRDALRGYLQRARPELDVDDVDVRAMGLEDSPVRYEYSGRLLRFAQRTGETLSSRLAVQFPSLPLRMPTQDRRVPMWLPDPLSWSQRTVFEIPSEARVAEVPSSAKLDSPWGTLRLDVRQRRGQVVCELEVVFRGGRVAVDQLDRFGTFARDARQLLDQRLLLEWP